MEIVSPKIDDLKEIVTASKVWYDAMNFDQCGKHFDEQIVTSLWKDSILSPFEYDVLIARMDGQIVGAFGIVYKTKHTWFRGVLQGYEHVFHADPRLPQFTQGRIMAALFKAMQPLIAQRNPEAVFIGCDPRFPGVQKMLEKHGAIPIINTVMLKGGVLSQT